MKKTTILMTFCLTAAMLFSSCEIFKKDDLLREDIVGEWDITSFTIDGVEAKGSVIKNSKMEFEKYSGTSGDFEWTITYADGTLDFQDGEYEIDEDEKEIELINDGQKIKLEMELIEDRLELEGTIDGERYILKARRD